MLGCKKHTNNIVFVCFFFTKKTNKAIRQKSGCASFTADKSGFLKQKDN